MSAEGTARAVKHWSSFQCTGIHHAVRARTYKGDEHLAYALNKSTAPLPFFYRDLHVFLAIYILFHLIDHMFYQQRLMIAYFERT